MQQTISIVVILVVFGVLSLQAQGSTSTAAILAREVDKSEIYLEQISIDQGLSQGMINAIVQDAKGYLWVATKDGLNRYDGKSFKVFRHDPRDSLTLADNYITSLFIDSRDQLWVCTLRHGLDLYQPATESFIHFTRENSGLSSNSMDKMVEAPNGNLLVKTIGGDGYDVLIPQPATQTIEVQNFKRVYPNLEHDQLLGPRAVSTCIAFTADGSLWYYNDRQLLQLTPEQQSEQTGFNSYHFDIYNSRRVQDDDILLMDEAKENLFILDDNGYLHQYDFLKKQFNVVLTIPRDFNLGIFQYLDNEANLWSLTKDHQLVRININNGESSFFYPHWEKIDEHTKQYVRPSLVDNYGNLWMSSGGNGLVKVNAQVGQFKKLQEPQKMYDGRIDLFRTVRPGRSAVLSQQAKTSWMRHAHLIEQIYRNKWEINYSSRIVLDNSGRFWIAGFVPHRPNDPVKFHSLIVIDSVKKTIKMVGPTDLPVWFGIPLILDQKGHVWAGHRAQSDTNYLFHFDPEKEVMRKYAFPVKTRKHEYPFISDWYEDTLEQVLWLGTTHGLFRFDMQTKSFTHFGHIPDDPTSLSGEVVFCVTPDPLDPAGVLWVGTAGQGLNRFDVCSGTFSHVKKQDGLPNDVIYGVQSDYKNNLWLSTNNGLCLYNPRTGDKRIFTKGVGLPGNEFNRYEFGRAEDGSLVFGGTAGVVTFHPKDFYQEGDPSPVVLNDLRIANEPVKYHPEGGFLKAPIEFRPHLTFQPGENMFSLGFTMLDFTNPQAQRFRYFMEGFNDKWIDAGTNNHATFTNLAPGDYTFKVEGMNSSGKWSEEPTTLSITVLPAWYATWWFRSSLVVLVVLILYWFYRYRLSQVLRIERMRNRIAQDLHDEIGSTLSSISLFGAVIQQSSDQMPQHITPVLGKIIDSTSEMMESMNDIVWTIKADNDSFEQVVYRMRAFALKMTEAKGIELRFEVDPKVEETKVSMEKRKNIYLIFKEALNNAIKYSDAQLISVVIQKENGILLEIKDNGKGFDPSVLDARQDQLGGNGLKGMTIRAREIGADFNLESRPGAGCRIRLHVR
ncbi:MAG: triple tyrosine motif-containing protein [Bacteroidia bacterium]